MKKKFLMLLFLIPCFNYCHSNFAESSLPELFTAIDQHTVELEKIDFCLRHNIFDDTIKQLLVEKLFELSMNDDLTIQLLLILLNHRVISVTEKNRALLKLVQQPFKKYRVDHGGTNWLGNLVSKKEYKTTAEIITLLLDDGADVNAIDEHKNTPLHKAVAAKNIPAIELLLQNGAQLNARNDFGQTPHDAANSTLLESYFVKNDKKQSDQDTEFYTTFAGLITDYTSIDNMIFDQSPSVETRA